MNYKLPKAESESLHLLPFTCRETNGKLNLTLSADDIWSKSLKIENSQYLSLDITYKGRELVIPGSKLYFLYAGNNYYFTGKQIQQIWFTSLELPFGHFYKTQISPFFKDELKNLWPWGQRERDVYFSFNEPYFIESFKNFEENQ